MLLQRRGALINVTGDATALSAAAPHISGFLSALPVEAGAPSDWRSMLPRQNEALVVPTQVCSQQSYGRRSRCWRHGSAVSQCCSPSCDH